MRAKAEVNLMRTFFRKRRNPDALGPDALGSADYDAASAPPVPTVQPPLLRRADDPYREPQRPEMPRGQGVRQEEARHDGVRAPSPRGRADGLAHRVEPRAIAGGLPSMAPPRDRGFEAPPEEGGGDEEMPRFAFPVSNGYRASMVSGIDPEVSRALREAFTPTRPKKEVNALFIGRLSTIRRVISAIEEERAHVVLYGDRGRGKTSLGNAVEQIASQAGYLPTKLTCSAELTFEDMFRTLLRRIPTGYMGGDMGMGYANPRASGTFDERLPAGSFTVTQLAEVMEEIAGTHVLMMLDEYDRIIDEDVKNKLAELIKNITDRGAPVTLFIIGVSETVEQLLGKHPSIQRAMVAVHLPPMTDREIERIIITGGEAAGISFAPEARRIIVALSKGLPYFAQLLSLHAARTALARNSREVQRADMADAVQRCAAEADRGLVETYHRIVGPDGRGRVADVLYLAAQASSDNFGSFQASDLTAVQVRQGERQMPSDALSDAIEHLAQGPDAVLEKVVLPSGHRLRFKNQMMRQVVLLIQAAQRGLV